MDKRYDSEALQRLIREDLNVSSGRTTSREKEKEDHGFYRWSVSRKFDLICVSSEKSG
jgi:hypothetical protein